MPAAVPSSTDPIQETRVVVGAIPARYGSTRLPGKPLRIVAGKTLIEHVYRRATDATELNRVVVLTDDARVFDAVSAFGGEVEMTPTTCVSGTDRIAAAARHWHATAIVNIQGDEPLIPPAAIDRVARHLRSEPGDPLVTLAAPATAEARDAADVVKVVVDLEGRALYFSRAAIPFGRDQDNPATLHHIGIYGYQRSALLELAAREPTPLERAESLEQLRALEHGMTIRVLQIERAWQGVDTMQDLERVEELLGRGAADDG